MTRPPALPWAGLAGGLLGALGVAALTVRLNAYLLEPVTDALLLLLYFSTGGALAGLAVGTVAEGLLRLAEGGRHLLRTRRAVAGALVVVPLLAFALLPQTGLAPQDLLTEQLFNAPPSQRAVAALLGIAVAAALGAFLLTALGRAPRGRLAAGAAGAVVAGALVAWAFAANPPTAGTGSRSPAPTLEPRSPPPPPVVLLVIDGADPVLLRELTDRGELPTFRRLLAEGTWGPLETIEPTLSAVVWTTLATGQPPEVHGVRHFVAFSLPGMSQVIQRFPLHTGLNFTVFPTLEKIPGVPPIQIPVTSRMRRSPTLWEIVGDAYPVGVYRWLVSWPVEPVNGFAVAGGVGWAQFLDPSSRSAPPQDTVYPPELAEGRLAKPRKVTEADLARYRTPGAAPPEADDPRWKIIRRTLRDASDEALVSLTERFEPRFLAAAFFSVDAFSHHFALDRRDGGPFAPAIEERYRETDARLGRFLDALAPDTHVLVVSDHGYDFEHNHHTWSPPGIFVARGPAFAAGARVDGLSVYDVAPLVLHLLELPLARDLPGTASARYRRALDRGWLDAHPVPTVATYDAEPGGSMEAVESPKDEEIREVLESLGYIR